MAMKYGSTSSCTVVGHGTRSEYQCRIGYEIVSENTSTNKREVKLQLEARTTSSNYIIWGVSQTPTIDGKKLSSTTLDLRTVNKWQVLGSRTITIIGAFSGKKTGSFTVNTSTDWALKSGSASVTLDLDDLHTPPVVNSVDLVEKNTQLNSYTGIVQFLSTKNITFDTSTYDDATISSYQVQHNGVLIGSSTSNGMTINFDEVGTLATFEMNGKTYATFKFIVIDSYGTSSSLEQQIEVIKYSKPNLVQTSSSIKRNGQLTGKVKLNLIGSFFNQSINGVANTISLKFAYWKKEDTESTTYYDIPFTASDNNINISDWNVAKNGTEISDVSKDYAYMFKIIATDYFNKKSEVTLLCPVGEYLWAEYKNRVDFKDITIQGAKIIESGSNDNGSYVKFEDGTMIVNQTIKDSTNISKAWGSLYVSEDIKLPDFPVQFIEEPTTVVSPQTQSGTQFMLVGSGGSGAGDETFGGHYALVRPNSKTGVAYVLELIAIGKWKD